MHKGSLHEDKLIQLQESTSILLYFSRIVNFTLIEYSKICPRANSKFAFFETIHVDLQWEYSVYAHHQLTVLCRVGY